MKSYLTLVAAFRNLDRTFSRDPRARHGSPLQPPTRRGRACPARPAAKRSAALVVLALAAGLAAPALCAAADGAAATPPMGWNSWDCYGTTVTEAEVKANADYMATRLKQHGWQYIVVDIQWSESESQGARIPPGCRAGDGRVRQAHPAVNRFPSAAGGRGFRPLADYVHSLGLRFGIHIMRGIPRQAVKANLPVDSGLRCTRPISPT
jgi:hypothetical protein